MTGGKGHKHQQGYVCHLTLPSLFGLEPIETDAFRTKHVAQAVAAWIACVLLIDTGYIDECLEPVKGQRLLRGNFEEFRVALTGPDRIVLPQTTYKQLGLTPILPPPIVVREESAERKEETVKKVEVDARKDAREQPPPSGFAAASPPLPTSTNTINDNGNEQPKTGNKQTGGAGHESSQHRAAVHRTTALAATLPSPSTSITSLWTMAPRALDQKLRIPPLILLPSPPAPPPVQGVLLFLLAWL